MANKWQGTEPRTASECLLSVLELLKRCTVEELENVDVNFTLKSKAGDEQTMRLTLQKAPVAEMNLVQPEEARNNESSDCAVTRRAPLAASSVVKSPSWPLLQNTTTRHLFNESNDINDVTLLSQYKQETVSYDKVTTVSCQPAEDQNAIYTSIKSSSLPNKGEKIDITGPFCEGLSGDIDDYSDYSTNDPEEGSLCMHTITPNIYIPDSPQPVLVEESSLVLPDGPSQSISACATSDSSGQYATCHSEVATTSTVPTAASEQQISE